MAHDALIATLPKAELHIHLEGSLEPELLFDLAARNGVDTGFESVDALRDAYVFSNLQEFLDIYYVGMRVLATERDFYDLAMAYFRRAREDNVRHVEAFFDPQAHTERGIPIAAVVDGLTAAVGAAAEVGITVQLIPNFLRHLSGDDALAAFDLLEPHLEHFTGVGLDSSEVGNPPGRFAAVFERARNAGLRCVAHAGEEGPPEYVVEALDLLHVDRIDHGNRALEDTALVERLVRDAIPLTVCPLSNLKLAVVRDLREHPLKRMLDAGLLATINSDDPAYFGGYVGDNYRAVANALDLSTDDIVTLAKNGFRAAFLPDADKERWLAEIDAVVSRIQLAESQ